MRDFVSCFNENAINVSHSSSCSSFSNNACISPALIPSVQNTVSCFYKIILSSQKQLLVTVTWFKKHTAQGLSISFGNESSTSFKLNTSGRLFRKKKGSKIIDSDSFKIEIFWDLSSAKYDSGPAPVDGFYVLVMVDSEIGLVLGDVKEETMFKKLKASNSVAKSSLISRQEHCSGNNLYVSKAKFCDTGIEHDVLIKCSDENEGLRYPVLAVCIDKKTVIRVKRLQWNFRGNQTIFVDGLLVDLMWDVHDWFYNPSSGSAVFMFKTRNGIESRLWLEEKLVQKDEERFEFSLLIFACRSP
ncbi:uncharacterized protein LOC110613922 [Manihot esculenta]|uniref:DUF868 domain-containing protein n=1 Tax=Manihot esculenta TaxID=3983 RepID=A0A2C9VYF5_MANES|nr:uncharacterized protein LOC110613922 [Manihot esculenta]OAY51453.1 hypothetical protein MANES_04G008000v8 [Manihot esculenta]